MKVSLKYKCRRKESKKGDLTESTNYQKLSLIAHAIKTMVRITVSNTVQSFTWNEKYQIFKVVLEKDKRKKDFADTY